jgi:hypothetical protein
MISKKMIAEIRKTAPDAIAAAILSVQPMDDARKAFKELYDYLVANPGIALVFKSREREQHNGTEETKTTEGNNSKIGKAEG